MQIDPKQPLRARMKARRSAVSRIARQQAARIVIEHAKAFLSAKKGRQVGLYYPVQSEFDTLPLAQHLGENAFELSLPVVIDEVSPLAFRPWNLAEHLQHGAFNIKIPTDKDLSVLPDVLIIPLLAFDKNGGRLGYGGGYYDRTLEKLRTAGRVVAMGLAYDFQQADQLPVELHDQRLDYILTPSGLHEF